MKRKPGKIWVKRYTKKKGTKVKGHYREDKGAPGKTPPSKQWFEPKLSLEKYNYDYNDAPSTRQAAIRAYAKAHGNSEKAWMALFHHFHGLTNLTKKAQPAQARAYHADAKFIDHHREKRFGSR